MIAFADKNRVELVLPATMNLAGRSGGSPNYYAQIRYRLCTAGCGQHRKCIHYIYLDFHGF